MKPFLLIVMLALTTSSIHSEETDATKCGKMEITDRTPVSQGTDVVDNIKLGKAELRATYCVDLLHHNDKVGQVQFVYYGLANATGHEVWGDFKAVSQTGKPIQLYFADNGYDNPLRKINNTHMLTGATKIAACISGEPIMFHPCLHEGTINVEQLSPKDKDPDFSDFNTWAKKCIKQNKH